MTKIRVSVRVVRLYDAYISSYKRPHANLMLIFQNGSRPYIKLTPILGYLGLEYFF